ncbi:acyl-CoA thioesterase [Legionella dresdenensis]|uniref:Acyl-CoA thioesterase n=1 Tax=Legionella dresdenensis TaxID=450200 RepID=A0ABV8CDJ2_9GAMM
MSEQKIKIHEKTFAIAWGDMDALGHVNNTRYFDYFQEARIEWLASQNLDMKQNIGPVVIHIACTFLKPVVYPATLTLTSTMHSLGRSSFIVDHDLLQDGQLMAQGTSKIVWIDYTQGKSVELPEAIRKMFA